MTTILTELHTATPEKLQFEIKRLKRNLAVVNSKLKDRQIEIKLMQDEVKKIKKTFAIDASGVENPNYEKVVNIAIRKQDTIEDLRRSHKAELSSITTRHKKALKHAHMIIKDAYDHGFRRSSFLADPGSVRKRPFTLKELQVYYLGAECHCSDCEQHFDECTCVKTIE